VGNTPNELKKPMEATSMKFFLRLHLEEFSTVVTHRQKI
jgi:hypothetical protein